MKLTINDLLLSIIVFFLTACQISEQPSTHLQSMEKAQLKYANSEVIDVYLALTEKEQEKGLSSIRPEQLADNEGMLFFYLHDEARSFWMPDTHFNLDIFFLDSSFKVLAVERNVAHYPHKDNLYKAARTPAYNSRHVLEMKSSSAIAQKIKKGSQLSWISSPSVWQIESKIRLGK